MSDGHETCRLCSAPMNSQAVMCFEDTAATSNKGDVVDILNRHFWFELNEERDACAFVCHACWLKVDAFNQFYESVLDMYQARVKSEPFDVGQIFEISHLGDGGDEDAESEDMNVDSEDVDDDRVVHKSVRPTIELPPLDIKSEELSDDPPVTAEITTNGAQSKNTVDKGMAPSKNEPSEQSDDDHREGDSSASSSTLSKNRMHLLSRLHNRRLRESSDPFGMPEPNFRRMFRLSRTAARDLLEELLANQPALRVRLRITAIPFHLKFLTVLNFLAQGSFQKRTGINGSFALSQTAVSRSLVSVLSEMMQLVDRYIKFPETPAEITRSKVDFMQRLRMPGIVGAFACRHVRILKPPNAQNGNHYSNRKGSHSLNVLAACNARQQFVFADATHAGAVRDAAIYQSIRLDEKLAPNAYVLGNSSFRPDRCMLTPIGGAAAGSKEEQYNWAHKHAHNAIGQAFGDLQRRFRCLNATPPLHYRPETAAQIVFACMVLHNICQQRNIPVEGVGAVEDEAEEAEVRDDDSCNLEGRRARDNYIQRNF